MSGLNRDGQFYFIAGLKPNMEKILLYKVKSVS